ncbi:MAG: TilS substrate-binding domain-containing protein, partial [Actinomycetota bacterium]|nr:TilS substrate-binding domain-containing protein [Actinomycetota bacterium]
HSQRMGEPAGPVGLRVDALASAPEALRRRVLRMAALEAGASRSDLAAGHVEAVGALLSDWHGQRGIDLPGRIRAVRSGGVLRLGPVAD